MKKYVNKLFCIILVIVVVAVAAVTVRAEMVYQNNNHRYTVLSDGSISLYGRTDSEGLLSIPGVIDDKMVVDIRNYAYFGDNNIVQVDFTDAYFLNRIGSFAFAGCNSLSGIITLPSGLSVLETGAFQETNINSIVFNQLMTVVPQQCCYNCSALSSVSLSDSITEIRAYAFSSCVNLKYVEIPSSVNVIADNAFSGDNDLTLGVYYASYAYQYALDKDIKYIILDPENVPTEPPTEPQTEAPTQAPTDEPTQPATEAPTAEPTQPVTEKPTESTGFILGDVDNNGVVSISDVTLIQRSLVNLDIPASCVISQGDVDNNGITGSSDAAFIMRYLINLTTRYPIGEIVTR